LAGPLKSPAVVRFLCDNTLGRIWHGMRHGDTRLSDVCKYLVHVSDQANERSADGLEKKDPRDIRVIDPACGSGHFLLYCFLLLLIIYEEAWADQDSPESGATGRTLRADPLQTSPALSSFCALWMTSNGEVEQGFCFG
jgi:hypothetical protein